jgi:hypothetical protein
MAAARVSQDDATWFAIHPKRNYRLRPVMAGEDLWGFGINFVAIYQLRPGTRMRMHCAGCMPPDSERNARRMFHRAAAIGGMTEAVAAMVAQINEHDTDDEG